MSIKSVLNRIANQIRAKTVTQTTLTVDAMAKMLNFTGLEFFGDPTPPTTVFPSDILSIPQNTFAVRNDLKTCDLTYYKTLKYIGSRAFMSCRSLTSVTFPASLISIGDYAFDICPNLTDIYCRFPEGQVSGAPWGATNATIHYDYTGE